MSRVKTGAGNWGKLTFQSLTVGRKDGAGRESACLGSRRGRGPWGQEEAGAPEASG